MVFAIGPSLTEAEEAWTVEGAAATSLGMLLHATLMHALEKLAVD